MAPANVTFFGSEAQAIASKLTAACRAEPGLQMSRIKHFLAVRPN
jgi:hypothetical protein